MLMVRRTPSYSLVTFYVRRSIAQFRNLTSETKNGDHEHPTKALDAKDCNFVYEICRITRTKPRWEDTLLSLHSPFFFFFSIQQHNTTQHRNLRQTNIMDAGYNPRTVEEVFRDFKGRRAALIKALTTGSYHFPLSSGYLLF